MPEAFERRKAAVPRPSRRGYLDWIRGIAVLIMIEAHVVDSWTSAPDRFSRAFASAMILGGFGAPLFLFDMRAIFFNTLKSYIPSPDGQRFLINMLRETSEAPINIVHNWTAGIDR